jgi:hypothetical protein
VIEPRFADLLRARHDSVLVTLRRDGRPQLSNVDGAPTLPSAVCAQPVGTLLAGSGCVH